MRKWLGRSAGMMEVATARDIGFWFMGLCLGGSIGALVTLAFISMLNWERL